MGCGNLGAPPHAAVAPVERLPGPRSTARTVCVERPGRRRGHVRLPDMVKTILAALDDLVAAGVPGVGHAASTWGNDGRPWAADGREVGAAVERLAVGRQEDVMGQPPLPGHRLHGAHVDAVQVGALFAIDLDADEQVVHELGRRLVLERLVLHDVAPVAGGVADGEEDGRSCFARARASAPQGYQSTGLLACCSR